MGLILGGGATRNNSAFAALGIKGFSENQEYFAGDYVVNDSKLYRFIAHHQGAWDASHVEYISNITDILDVFRDPRMKAMSAQNLEEGDMAFFDKVNHEYVIVKKAAIAAVLADYNTKRYETNYDTYVGTVGGMAHFTAIDDAYSQAGMYTGAGDAAAEACYYRLEIDNTANGSITFSAASGNGSIASTTISWNAGDTMASIVALFTAKNTSYITFAALADGKGVGLSVGGYGANTLTVTDSTSVVVIDCSSLSFLRSKNPAAPAVGGTFNPQAAWEYLNRSSHHNFRGATARSILSSAYPNIVANNASCVANSGYDYSYRTILNFAKGKEWASSSGDSTFYSDGVNGSTNSSTGHIMKKATFDSNVVSTATGNALKMYEYYNHLFNDQSGDYATLRHTLESYYGQMTDLYDAYLMCHCVDPAANSGITYTMLNKGDYQTTAKADLMTVTYDYAIVPAYPPEYNAKQYGVSTMEGFAPGAYYHPEPSDHALRYRADNFALINENVTTANTGRALANNEHRGSCADYYGGYTWCFVGGSGMLNYYDRSYGSFRSRPALALPLSA